MLAIGDGENRMNGKNRIRIRIRWTVWSKTKPQRYLSIEQRDSKRNTKLNCTQGAALTHRSISTITL